MSTDHGSVFYQVQAIRVDNLTPETDTFDVSNTVSATVGISVTASGSHDASIIVESVHVSIGTTVSASLTVTSGTVVHVTVPPHLIRYARYGVYREWDNGTYSKVNPNCTSSTFPMTTYTPFYVGYQITTS